MAWIYHLMSYIMGVSGQVSLAHDYILESLHLYREIGNKQGIARALNNLVAVLDALGQHDEQAAMVREALALSRELGDYGRVAWMLSVLSHFSIEGGDFAEADALVHEALHFARELGAPGPIALALMGCTDLASLAADNAETLRLAHECLSYAERSGNFGLMRGAQHMMTLAMCLQGDHEAAARYFAPTLKALLRLKPGSSASPRFAHPGPDPESARPAGASRRITPLNPDQPAFSGKMVCRHALCHPSACRS